MRTLSVAINAQDHVLGNPDAPCRLVEYGDYECPYCGAAFPRVKRIQDELGDNLLFVFRNFPLGEMHPHAEHAVETAEFAAANGRDWKCMTCFTRINAPLTTGLRSDTRENWTSLRKSSVTRYKRGLTGSLSPVIFTAVVGLASTERQHSSSTISGTT